jgi:hypothetical protein
MPDTNNASATRAQSEVTRTQSGNVLLRESGMFERFPHLNDASLPVDSIRLTECSSGGETRVSMLGMSGDVGERTDLEYGSFKITQCMSARTHRYLK